MFKPESPNTMFKLLYTRYGKCVGIWIYDNGCKVLEYLLNRESLITSKVASSSLIDSILKITLGVVMATRLMLMIVSSR